MAVSAPKRPPIGIKHFGARGRGVYAVSDIDTHTLVERSPVLIIPGKDRVSVDQTVIFTYVFMWEHQTTEEDLYKHEGRSAIALGYTSLINHSPHPNCRFHRHIDDLVIDLISLCQIKKGQEITIDYQMTLWFTPDEA